MKKAGPVLEQVRRHRANIWEEKTTRVALGIIILITQAGFWTGVAWDGAFDHRNLQESLSICVNTLQFCGPALGIVLMGSIPAARTQTDTSLITIPARMAATTATLILLPGIAFLTLMASIGIAELISTGTDTIQRTPAGLVEMLETHGRAVYGSMTFAAMSALTLVITRSRRWTIGLTLVWYILENILIDLATGWSQHLSWIIGLAPAHLYYHWTLEEEAIWSMKNILGMEDRLQGLLILGIHTAWMGAAAVGIQKYRGRETDREQE